MRERQREKDTTLKHLLDVFRRRTLELQSVTRDLEGDMHSVRHARNQIGAKDKHALIVSTRSTMKAVLYQYKKILHQLVKLNQELSEKLKKWPTRDDRNPVTHSHQKSGRGLKKNAYLDDPAVQDLNDRVVKKSHQIRKEGKRLKSAILPAIERVSDKMSSKDQRSTERTLYNRIKKLVKSQEKVIDRLRVFRQDVLQLSNKFSGTRNQRHSTRTHFSAPPTTAKLVDNIAFGRDDRAALIPQYIPGAVRPLPQPLSGVNAMHDDGPAYWDTHSIDYPGSPSWNQRWHEGEMRNHNIRDTRAQEAIEHGDGKEVDRLYNMLEGKIVRLEQAQAQSNNPQLVRYYQEQVGALSGTLSKCSVYLATHSMPSSPHPSTRLEHTHGVPERRNVGGNDPSPSHSGQPLGDRLQQAICYRNSHEMRVLLPEIKEQKQRAEQSRNASLLKELSAYERTAHNYLSRTSSYDAFAR